MKFYKTYLRSVKVCGTVFLLTVSIRYSSVRNADQTASLLFLENDKFKDPEIWNLVLILRPIRNQLTSIMFQRLKWLDQNSKGWKGNLNLKGSLKILSLLAPFSSNGKHLTHQDRYLFIFQLNFDRCMNDSLTVHFLQDFIDHPPYSKSCGSYSHFPFRKVHPVTPGTAGYKQTSAQLWANHMIKEALPNRCRKKDYSLNSVDALGQNPVIASSHTIPENISRRNKKAYFLNYKLTQSKYR